MDSGPRVINLSLKGVYYDRFWYFFENHKSALEANIGPKVKRKKFQSHTSV